MFTNLIIIVFLIIFTVLMLSYGLSGLSIAPWVPCKKKDLERINNLADLKPGQVFYELGCGDGRVSRYIAKKNPDVNVIGIELSVLVFLWAKIFSFFYKQDNLKIKFGDAFKEDLAKADVVYTFALIKSINGKLKNKFEKELKKGAKVLSYVFSIEDWKGSWSVSKPDDKSSSIYVYKL